MVYETSVKAQQCHALKLFKIFLKMGDIRRPTPHNSFSTVSWRKKKTKKDTRLRRVIYRKDDVANIDK